jgi:hypothetical protein
MSARAEILQELEVDLEELRSDAEYAYVENGRGDYEAGVVQGLKRALELVEALPR